MEPGHRSASADALGKSLVPALAGPLLIVAGVLVLLHGFWLSPKLTNQHVDLLSFWYPRWCFLGQSLSSGHIPTWLPYQAGGVPFASDPQSGWLDLPVMVLFSTLSCARALGLVIVFHPALAGLGLYLFFRKEGLGRPAATIGGLTLALGMAGSAVVLTMPFAATLAWTALALGGAAGFLHARGAVRVLAWLALTALALSQVAAAHFSNGLLIALLEVGTYVLLRSILQVRRGERSLRAAFVIGVGLFASLPLLAAAVWVPRLALLPRTSLGHGYVELSRLATQLSGAKAPSNLGTHGRSAWWGTSFARGPGGYIGALAILLIPVALSSRRRWLPAAGFAAIGLIGWALTLDALVASKSIRRLALHTPIGELWLRDPGRFSYLVLVAFAALAGYGAQAWVDLRRIEGRPVAVRALWLLPGIVVFALVPIAAGSPLAPYLVFAVASVVFIPLLLMMTRSPRVLPAALAGAVAVELIVVGLLAQGRPSPGSFLARSLGGTSRFAHSFGALAQPKIEPAAYESPGAIGRTLIQDRQSFGRYLSFDPDIARQRRAFLSQQGRASWPAYENARSVLFHIDEIQGYLPVQLDRYWKLVRRVDPVPIQYNHAAFQSDPLQILSLFGVKWMIQRTDLPPPAGSAPVAGEGRYTLYRLLDAEPRASLVSRWQVMSSGAALDAVIRDGFDPAQLAILESTPSIPAGTQPNGSPTGSAVYSEPSPENAIVRVDSSAPAILVVRNAYDRNWHATIDGRPARLMIGDYMMQALAVPAGSHVVELRYEDRAVGLGLLISALSWAALGVAVLAIFWSHRRRRAGLHGSPADEPGRGGAA